MFAESFFKAMHRVLRPGGMITIVTDNRLYARALAESVHSLNTTSCPAERGAGYFACLLSGEGAPSYASPQTTPTTTQTGHVEHSAMSNTDDSDSDDNDENGRESLASSETCLGEGKNSDTPQGALAKGCAIMVCPGEPGEKGGHFEVEESSSYFSRMWKHGNKARVWHLVLTKVS